VNNTGDQGPCLFPAEEQGPRYSKPQSTHDKTALTINAAGLLAVPRRAILRTDSKLLLLRVLGLFSREATTVRVVSTLISWTTMQRGADLWTCFLGSKTIMRVVLQTLRKDACPSADTVEPCAAVKRALAERRPLRVVLAHRQRGRRGSDAPSCPPMLVTVANADPVFPMGRTQRDNNLAFDKEILPKL
jgi:hypothetical protein